MTCYTCRFLGVMLLIGCVWATGYKQDKCLETLERGHCRAKIPSWGYVEDVGDCVQFIYGGCGGNANNFATAEECIDKCVHPRSCYDDIDQLWYSHQETKEGGYGCGGCTCVDGLFECGSCKLTALVCSNVQCDNKCDFGYKIDELGCDTCDCKAPPDNYVDSLNFYCREVCKFCTSSSKMTCPDECDC